MSEVHAALQDNNDRISTKTAASLPLFKGQSKEDVDEFLTELLPLSIHGEKTKRLESPSMYLSSKETQVAGSLLLTNLVKAIVKALCEQYNSAIRDSFVNNSTIVQTKTKIAVLTFGINAAP